jgi:hypothetical protein
MVAHRWISLSGALLLAGVAVAWSQEPRIEQARQFQAQTSGLTSPVETAGPTSFQTVQGVDSESFGVQQMLRESERLRLFRAFADVSAFVTNNVALTRTDPVTDSFLIATFGFELRRPLPRGFQIESTLRVATFRYNEFRQLDFNSVDVGGGVSYHSERLGGIDLFARYNFNALIGAEADEAFFKNHTVTVGAQKAVPFSQAHYAFFGVAGQLGFADPKVAERSELSAFAGYHLQATRNLQADLLYRYAHLIYSEGGRIDRNQTVSLALRYRLTDWLTASASVFVGRNQSNQEVFDYDLANGGGGLTLSIQF